jgi:hypothetical protein
MPTLKQLQESCRVQQWLGIKFDWTPVSSDTDEVIKLTWKIIGKLIISENWEKQFIPNTAINKEDNSN